MNSNNLFKIIFYTKTRHIGVGFFPKNVTLNNIKQYYKQNLYDGTSIFYKKYYINSKIITDSDIISNIIPFDKNILEISLAFELREAEELKHQFSLIKFDDENEEIYSQIIKPKLNPFGLIVFLSKNSAIQIEQYPEEILKKYNLDKFNKNYAYCNSPNFLFLSGENNFWIINKKNYAINHIKLKLSKINHSIVYIPDIGVFIVGGDSKKTFLYDINTKKFKKWGDTNNIYFKPALIYYDEYLYCFQQLNKKIKFFEKTYLGENTRKKWEIIYPRFKDMNPKEFYNNDFAVSLSTEGKILLIGGKKSLKHTYIFNPLNDTIIKTEGENEKINFGEKIFYKLNKVINIAIPEDFEENKELAFLNKYQYSLQKAKYKNITKGINIIYDFNYENNLELINDNSLGNCSIQIKFEEINNYNKEKLTVMKTIGIPIFSQINYNKYKQQNKKCICPHNIKNASQRNLLKNKNNIGLKKQKIIKRNNSQFTLSKHHLDNNTIEKNKIKNKNKKIQKNKDKNKNIINIIHKQNNFEIKKDIKPIINYFNINKINEIKIDEIKINENKNDEIKIAEIKIDEVKINENKNDENKNEENKIRQNKNDEIKTDEIKIDEIKINENKIDENKFDEIKEKNTPIKKEVENIIKLEIKPINPIKENEINEIKNDDIEINEEKQPDFNNENNEINEISKQEISLEQNNEETIEPKKEELISEEKKEELMQEEKKEELIQEEKKEENNNTNDEKENITYKESIKISETQNKEHEETFEVFSHVKEIRQYPNYDKDETKTNKDMYKSEISNFQLKESIQTNIIPTKFKITSNEKTLTEEEKDHLSNLNSDNLENIEIKKQYESIDTNKEKEEIKENISNKKENINEQEEKENNDEEGKFEEISQNKEDNNENENEQESQDNIKQEINEEEVHEDMEPNSIINLKGNINQEKIHYVKYKENLEDNMAQNIDEDYEDYYDNYNDEEQEENIINNEQNDQEFSDGNLDNKNEEINSNKYNISIDIRDNNKLNIKNESDLNIKFHQEESREIGLDDNPSKIIKETKEINDNNFTTYEPDEDEINKENERDSIIHISDDDHLNLKKYQKFVKSIESDELENENNYEEEK